MTDTSPEDAADPRDLLRLLSRTERLEALPRTGWVVSGVSSPESVAAHVYGVAMTALWLADHLEEPIDTERVLRIALLHDLSEVVLTDLPKPTKDFIGAEHIEQAEQRALDVVLATAPPRWRADAAQYGVDSIEGRVVKAADKIQMYAKAMQYEAQGRGDLRRFWENFPPSDYGIGLVARVYAQIASFRRDGDWYESDFD